MLILGTNLIKQLTQCLYARIDDTTGDKKYGVPT